MEERKYNFGSPEVQQFLGLSPNVTDPSARQQHIRKLVDRLGLADVPGNYENAFFKQGILPEDLEAIKKYVGFGFDWKSAGSVDTINKLTEIAQSNPSDIYIRTALKSLLFIEEQKLIQQTFQELERLFPLIVLDLLHQTFILPDPLQKDTNLLT